MSEYRDASGRVLSPGKKLGSGGEGAVYELPSLNAAMKIYHQPLPAEKQQKLQALVDAATPALLKVAAWPVALVYKNTESYKDTDSYKNKKRSTDAGSQNTRGEVCGLVMPKLGDYEPLHHLYSPAQRKQKFPDKSWAFLLHVARNIACVFDVIHAHGHVIGDVNPNLVYVDGQGLIRLIDCDSFQIDHQQQVFGCDVGVPHFMPPELQNKTSFRGCVRHPSQDSFGLALLIFHLLLMGRHPYAGVRADRRDYSLEQSIAESAYAFADDAMQRGLRPPPNSISPSILPPALRQLFSSAFIADPIPEQTQRPAPRQWMDALSQCQLELQRCSQVSLHSYWKGLSICPWCEHQDRNGVYFFLSLDDKEVSSDFDLRALWARFTQVSEPSAPTLVTLNPQWLVESAQVISPHMRQLKWVCYLSKLVVCLSVLSAFLLWPWQVELIIFLGNALLLPNVDFSFEKQRRLQMMESIQREYHQWQDQLQRLSSKHPFFMLRQRLQQMRLEYESLGEEFLRAQHELKKKRYERQLQKFLDGFLVSNTTIPSIGVTRRAMLLSFGIETAADVSIERLQSIPNFSPKISYELVDWRQRLQVWFVFDATADIDPQDMAMLKQRFAYKRTKLQTELRQGVMQLQMQRGDLHQQYQQIQLVIDAFGKRVHQFSGNKRV